jgi:NADH-quinone oxidoreductase subunit A
MPSTLSEFGPVAVMIVIAILLSLVILFLSRIFGPYRPSFRKNAPYESGMKPIGPGSRRVPVKFYLVAVLFIIFDIEVIYFLPWAVVMRQLGVYGLIVMGLFTLILVVGFIYEWKKGALEWD